MSDDTVCVECFADDFLRDFVRNGGSPSGEDDVCCFCRSIGQPRRPAGDLAGLFERVVYRLFRSDQQMELVGQQGSGEPLGDLFRDRIGTLNPDMDEPDELIRAVLSKRWTNRHQDDDYPDLDATWILAEDDFTADPSYEDALQTLRGEVLQLGHSLHFGSGKHVARDLLHTELAYDRIKRALERTAVTLEGGTKLYRARLDLAKNARGRVEEFLPPPVRFAKAARANLQGERVWYLARESETARAELRPSRGSEVSVAAFILPRQLRLCGLDPRLIDTSPFEDLDKFEKDKAVAEVANAMGDMFAEPIRPSDTDTEYVITQFLARMVREDGFDGIAYPSSQNPDGLNYVLFDPTVQCAFGPVQTYECERVTYAWSETLFKRAIVRFRPREDDDSDDDRFDDDE
jgi:hypothetical protein